MQTAENVDLPFDIVLRDGSTLALRPATAVDVAALCAFFEGLSPVSRYYRFFSMACPDAETVRRLVPRNSEGAALVGEVANSVVAFAGFYVDPVHRERAEVAFAIADRLQGRGIGTRVLERLADLARPAGIRTFDAYVLAGNDRMMECFLDSGYRASRHVDADGVVHVELSLEPTLEHLERAAQRSQVAAAASIDFLAPVRAGDTLTATARELWRGGRSGLYEIVVANQRGEQVALFRGRSQRVRGRLGPQDSTGEPK